MGEVSDPGLVSWGGVGCLRFFVIGERELKKGRNVSGRQLCIEVAFR